MLANGLTRLETRPDKVDEWTGAVVKAAEPLLSSKVDSWQTGVNRNGVHFRRTTDEVARGGYKEFVFR